MQVVFISQRCPVNKNVLGQIQEALKIGEK
jgi:hypothetical protein